MSGQEKPTLVFDVNETLIDMSALAPLFAEHLGDASFLKEWFRHLLQYSQTVTLAGPYSDFSSLAKSALEMTARMHGRELTEEGGKAIFSAIRSLPVHPDVPIGLRMLRDHNFRLVAFTNSTQSVIEEQLHNLGLFEMFHRVISVDRWKKFKPHPDVYRNMSKEIETDPQQIIMVAAHAWDLMGARWVGCRTAFIEREPGSWFPGAEKPDFWGRNLEDVARLLVAT